jgi:hypothetical protein
MAVKPDRAGSRSIQHLRAVDAGSQSLGRRLQQPIDLGSRWRTRRCSHHIERGYGLQR